MGGGVGSEQQPSVRSAGRGTEDLRGSPEPEPLSGSADGSGSAREGHLGLSRSNASGEPIMLVK